MEKYLKIFAERLFELREEKNLSQVQLSKSLKIAHSSISRWENEKTDIKTSQLIIVANFFNVSTDYLLGLSDDYKSY